MKKHILLYLFLLMIATQSCWLSIIKPKQYESKLINFETNYLTTFKNGKISKNDTLWFELSPQAQQIDFKTKQIYQLQNASFAFSARLRPVKQIDLKTFNSFQIVMKKGKLQNISYANYDESMIDFDMRFGCPSENKLIFGLILKEKGIYYLATGGNVFFGQNRTDCSDFTYKNENGYFSYRFTESDINNSIFESLTPVEKQKYGLNDSQKKDKTAILFEVID